MGAPLGPWGAAGGAVIGGLYSAFSGGGDNAAPAPPPSQYGGNELTNQLAAQQYAAGLQQQQGQNAREAAFYGNAQGNFDIANAAQMRGGPQIASTAEDRARQIAALGGTNAAIGNVSTTGSQLAALGNQSSNQVTATGDRLTELGTRPMGASYAEAQLRQGQDAAMAQQLAMARSGRSLGSGQASMQQAMFNNAALNQQTNLAAANARIQEQNAYNQFQAGTLSQAGSQYNANNQFQASALGAAGQQYGAAGALSGQAGGQATTIRQGNEGVQAQNAQLQQNQQNINNQTTGVYNQLGAQQQGYGMQANAQGQNAFQFGANQASGAQQAQLNADTGRLSAATATNLANQQNSNNRDAATMGMISAGAGAAGEALGNQSASAVGTANNPSGSTSPYSNITKASNSAGGGGQRLSDEKLKTNIKALGGGAPATPSGETSKPGLLKAPKTRAPASADASRYSEFSPEDAAAYQAADARVERGEMSPFRLIDDENAGKVGVAHETNIGDRPSTYAETIAALNSGYRASQFAPTDVLNHVPGAGAPPSASQSALLAHMTGKPQAAALNRGTISDAESRLRYNPDRAAPLDTSPFRQRLDWRAAGSPKSQAQTPAKPAPWGDVFNAPQFDAKVTDYLAGGNPYAPKEPENKYDPAYSDAYRKAEIEKLKETSPWDRMSDARSKTRIRELEGQLAALQGSSSSFEPQEPDTDSLDGSEYGRQVRPGGWRDRDQLKGPQSYRHRWDADPFETKERGAGPKQPDFEGLDDAHARSQTAPAVDFRPARPYEYEYKDPNMPGAAPGKHVGPMAQDLLRSPTTAATVHDTPQGLQVDTPRLTLAVAGAMSEQQRKTEELERQLAALQGSKPAAHDPKLYPTTRAPR